MSLSEYSKPYYSPAEIASIISDCGYKVQIDQLESGRKVIRSATSGWNFLIYMYGPNDEPEKIYTIQFTLAIVRKPTLQEINKWNAEKRFLKAYIDNDGDLWLEWDVVLKYVAPLYLKECIEYFDLILGSLNEI
jgi:hypothetical protein